VQAVQLLCLAQSGRELRPIVITLPGGACMCWFAARLLGWCKRYARTWRLRSRNDRARRVGRWPSNACLGPALASMSPSDPLRQQCWSLSSPLHYWISTQIASGVFMLLMWLRRHLIKMHLQSQSIQGKAMQWLDRPPRGSNTPCLLTPFLKILHTFQAVRQRDIQAEAGTWRKGVLEHEHTAPS